MSIAKRMNDGSATRLIEYRLIGIPGIEALMRSCKSFNVADKVPLTVRKLDRLGRKQRVTTLMCAITTFHNDKQKDKSLLISGLVHLRGAQHLLHFSVMVFLDGTPEGDFGLLAVTVPPSARMP